MCLNLCHDFANIFFISNFFWNCYECINNLRGKLWSFIWSKIKVNISFDVIFDNIELDFIFLY